MSGWRFSSVVEHLPNVFNLVLKVSSSPYNKTKHNSPKGLPTEAKTEQATNECPRQPKDSET